MDRGELNVLLIAENERACGELARRLEKKGFRSWFASTASEVRFLLDERGPFHLVLSTRPVLQGSALLELLSSFSCEVFYSYPIEDSCLWLRAANDGQACTKSPALRPSEFAVAVDAIVRQRSQSTAA
jgi:hypothetical protein